MEIKIFTQHSIVEVSWQIVCRMQQNCWHVFLTFVKGSEVTQQTKCIKHASLLLDLRSPEGSDTFSDSVEDCRYGYRGLTPPAVVNRQTKFEHLKQHRHCHTREIPIQVSKVIESQRFYRKSTTCWTNAAETQSGRPSPAGTSWNVN